MSTRFWLANDYNVFVINDHTQSNAFATGKVWVGQTATYRRYNIGAELPAETVGDAMSLKVAGNMNITGGTNYTQNSGIGAQGTVTAYSMLHLNGVNGQPKRFPEPNCAAVYDYLRRSSVGWGSLAANGTLSLSGTILTLTGNNTKCNVFLINTTQVADTDTPFSAITTVSLQVPEDSTVLLNLYGTAITISPLATLYHDLPITTKQEKYLLWNFPNATSIQLGSDLFGAMLAPYAAVSTDAVTIHGTFIAQNLTGMLCAVNSPFVGTLPDLYPTQTSPLPVAVVAQTNPLPVAVVAQTNPLPVAVAAAMPPVSPPGGTIAQEKTIAGLMDSIVAAENTISHMLKEEIPPQAPDNATDLQSQLLSIYQDILRVATSMQRLEIDLNQRWKDGSE